MYTYSFEVSLKTAFGCASRLHGYEISLITIYTFCSNLRDKDNNNNNNNEINKNDNSKYTLHINFIVHTTCF